MDRQKGRESDLHSTEGSQLSGFLRRNKKLFHCGNVYLAINEYTETEAGWVGKAPVPYETIYSCLQLVPFFCCRLSSCVISAREWMWVRRKESPMAVPLSKGRREKKGRRKTAEPDGTSPSLLHFDSEVIYPNEQSPKNISEEPIPATSDSLHELVQFVKIFCIQHTLFVK